MNETPFGPQGTLIGKTLGDYELVELLTSGGMARIYKGLDVRLQRYAAVKVLMRELLDSDESLPERFQREARAVAQLDHPNIVSVYQTGEQDGYMFIAMRLIEGNDLADEITRLRRLGQMMDPRRAIAILGQVADALDYAHARGIIHRDFKPSNILLDAQDRAYLTDFGLALWQSKDKTMGTAFGTPRYIAPEQALASETAVPASDIYAMAVVLYEILTGDMLFRADTPMQIALSHISEPPPSPRAINPNVPEGVERELMRALAKDSKARHKTAGEFMSAVKAAYDQADATATPLSSPFRQPPVDQPSTVVVPDARTPVSQRRPLPPSPLPPRSHWPYYAVAAAVVLIVLFLGTGWLFGAIRDRANADGTATQARAVAIAALSATHTPTATSTPTATNTPTATDTPTATATATEATATTRPSATATDVPTGMPTTVGAGAGTETTPVDGAATTEARQSRATDRAAAASQTSAAGVDLRTPQATETDASTVTQTAERSATDTDEPTATETGTDEPTLSATDELTVTDTDEPTPTTTDEPIATETDEPTATDTSEPTRSTSVAGTVTPSNTRPPTSTSTPRPSPTPRPTETATTRPTATATLTATEADVVLPDLSAVPTFEPVTLILRYDLDFFVVTSESGEAADVSGMTFVNGSIPEQRLGGSVPLTTLAAGQCSVMQRARRTFDANEYECPVPISRLTQLPATSVFWHGGAGMFEVRWDGETIEECPLATRTGAQTCAVVLR